MKVFIFLIISLSFTIYALGQGYPDTGFTNKAEAKNLLVNGLKEGKWVEYVNERGKTDEANALRYILTIYESGKPSGIGREYFNSGVLERETPYGDGKINGLEKFYYKTGTLREEATYTNGKENGMLKIYYKSGKLESEIPYKNGFMIGGGKSFYENGSILSIDRDTTINGSVYIAEEGYYEDGKIKSKTIWYNEAEGDTRYYDENGKEIK